MPSHIYIYIYIFKHVHKSKRVFFIFYLHVVNVWCVNGRAVLFKIVINVFGVMISECESTMKTKINIDLPLSRDIPPRRIGKSQTRTFDFCENLIPEIIIVCGNYVGSKISVW